MNRALFLKHFEVVASSPDRIPALRKLIFAHLVHAEIQSSDAEARASELREQYHPSAEKKKKSNGATTGPVAIEDLPPDFSALPCTLFERLGNVASIEKGLSQIQKTEPGPYPLVVTAEARSSSKSYDFEGPAVIVPMVSSTGHGDASLKRIHYQEGKYAVGNILSVIRPIRPDLIGARFLFEYLSAFKEELLVSRMVGTANVSLTVNKLLEVPVPLISGPVVERIDGLMALCDELEARQTAAREQRTRLVHSAFDHLTAAANPADFRRHADFALRHFPHLTATPDSIPALRQGILALAVRGQLCVSRSDEGSVHDTFRRPLALPPGFSRRAKRPKDTAIALPENLFVELPSSWAYLSIQELYDSYGILDFQDGNHGSFYPRKGEFGPEGIRFVTAAQIEHGRVVWERVPFLNSKSAEKLTKGWAQGGDVLLTHNASVGDVALADEASGTFLLGTSVTYYRVHPDALVPNYLFYVFQSPIWQKQLASVMEQTTRNQVSIQKQAFFKIPVPPLAEQQRIVAKVTELMSWCDQLEAQLAAEQSAAAALLDSSLHALLAPSPAP